MKKKRSKILLMGVVFLLALLCFAGAALAAESTFGEISVTNTGLADGDQDFTFSDRNISGKIFLAEGTRSIKVSFSPSESGYTLKCGNTTISSTSTSVTVSGDSGTLDFSLTGNGTEAHFLLDYQKVSTALDNVEVTANGKSLKVTKSNNKYTTDTAPYSATQAEINVTPEFADAVDVTIDGKSGTRATVDLTEEGSNTFAVSVALKGTSTKTVYSVVIKRGSGDVNTLDDLTLNGDTIKNFKTTTTSYSITTSDSKVTIVGTPSDSSAKVTYSFNDGSFSSSLNNRSLSSGTNTVVVRVAPSNGSAAKDYTLKIKKGSDSNYLDDLDIDPSSGSAKWNRSFSRSTTSYTITIPSGSSSLRVRPYAEDDNAEITVKTTSSSSSGTDYFSGKDSGEYSRSISISSSRTTTIYIKVTPSEGSTKTYTLKVSRGSSSSSSDDASLKKLVVKYGSTTYDLMPAFDEDITDYYVVVPEKASYITITPTAQDSDAEIEVDGEWVDSGDASDRIDIDTSSSGNRIDIDVTSPDGDEDQTYTVRVYRSDYSSGSGESTLDNLTIRTGKSSSSVSNTLALSPTFTKNTTSYTASMDSSHAYAQIRASYTNSRSLMFAFTDEGAVKLSDNSYSSSLDIPSKTSTITVRVYNSGYDKHTDYKVRLNGSNSNSGDADLSSLLVTDNNGKTVALSPSFSRSTYSYTAEVGTDITGVRFRAIPRDSDAEMTLDGSTLKSGTTSSLISLSNGANAIRLKVVADNGDVQTYTITVYRGTSAPSGDTTSSVTISMKLNSKTMLYNGVEKQMDVAPYTYKDRTMVPIRFVSEYLGGTVDWNGATKTVTIKYNNKTLTMVVGKANTAVGLDVPPMMKSDRTMVPIRYVSEQLGATVDWLNETKEVRIVRK